MALQILYVYKLAIQWKSAQLLSVGIVLVPRAAGFFCSGKQILWLHSHLIAAGRQMACKMELAGILKEHDKIRIVILYDSVWRCGSIHGDLCGCNRMEKYFWSKYYIF